MDWYETGKDFSANGKDFQFVKEEGCVCDKCIFNHMGSEGATLCDETEGCEGGYYILKPE